MSVCVSLAETIHALCLYPLVLANSGHGGLMFICHHLASSTPLSQADLLGRGTQELHMEVADTRHQ